MSEPTNNDSSHRRSVDKLHEEIAGILRKLRFSYEAIISIDESQRVVIFNKGAEKIFGYEASEVIGKSLDLLIPQRFRAVHKEHVERLTQSDENDLVMHQQKSIFGLRKNNEEFPAESSIYVFNYGGERTFTAVLRDVSEAAKLQERLLHLASHDYLTALPNRLLFDDRLATAISRAERNNKKMSLLFLDMNNFKSINDRLGHQAGDIFLRVIGERIQTHIRESDTAARIGGDEFALILEDINDRQTVEQTVHNLRDSLETAMILEQEEIIPSFSIGIALYPDDAGTADLLLKKADSEMFADKKTVKKQ